TIECMLRRTDPLLASKFGMLSRLTTGEKIEQVTSSRPRRRGSMTRLGQLSYRVRVVLFVGVAASALATALPGGRRSPRAPGPGEGRPRPCTAIGSGSGPCDPSGTAGRPEPHAHRWREADACPGFHAATADRLQRSVAPLHSIILPWHLAAGC